MLQYNTVSEELLELLKNLQQIPEFSELRLVGGTSLALQYGHRKSVDIDLFGSINIDFNYVSSLLSEVGLVRKLHGSKNINIFSINNIKVDIVNYNYKWIDKPVEIDGIKLASPIDIAAMKLNAITGRGTKKDFIDLYFLLKHFTLNKMMDFYSKKYSDGSAFLVIKSLSYFEDANDDEMPFMLEHADWHDVKEEITSETLKLLNH